MIKAEHISMRYFRKTGTANYFYAVQPTDLSIQPGELAVLMGRSGSGKTTLLNMLSGLLKPTEGTVRMDDLDLYSLDDRALSHLRGTKIAVVPQGRSAIDTLTVLENVMLPASISGSCGGAAQRARELLDRMQIANLADVMPGELSGGEQRRMAVARALMRDPDIIFADEPTSDLDAGNTAAVLQILKEEAKSGKAVFVVSHEARISEYADVMYDIKEGRLLQ